MINSREEALNLLAKHWIEQGKLIEAGWIAMQLACIPPDAPQIQLDEMRMAFFGGAQHLFGTIMNVLDPDAEPTEADLKKMDQIDRELKTFIAEFEKKHGISGRTDQ
jgi:hypothetical protein